MKIRHLLLTLLALLAIAFMQPLITFLGGLTLLLGVGAFIFRDLTPAGQDAVERRVLGWLRRARVGPTAGPGQSMAPPHRSPVTAAESSLPVERSRRGRPRVMSPTADSIGDGSAPPSC